MKKSPEELIKMVNGAILNIMHDTDSTAGCETCDYGSSYIDEITVELTEHTINVKFNEMYDHVMSEGDVMRLFIGNLEEIKGMTEQEFSNTWFKEKMEEYNEDLEYNVITLQEKIMNKIME